MSLDKHCSIADPDPLERFRRHQQGLESALESTLELVNSLLERRPDKRRGVHTAAVAKIEDLQRELLQHFALEEMGGYLSEVLAIAPQHSRRAETLAGSHGLLRDQLGRLLTRARRADPDSTNWEVLRADLHCFSAEILIHEEAEARLVSDVFLQDLGIAG